MHTYRKMDRPVHLHHYQPFPRCPFPRCPFPLCPFPQRHPVHRRWKTTMSRRLSTNRRHNPSSFKPRSPPKQDVLASFLRLVAIRAHHRRATESFDQTSSMVVMQKCIAACRVREPVSPCMFARRFVECNCAFTAMVTVNQPFGHFLERAIRSRDWRQSQKTIA